MIIDYQKFEEYIFKKDFFNIEKLISNTEYDKYTKQIIHNYISGDSKLLKIFIKYNKINTSYQKELILRSACEHGDVEIVEILLKDKKTDISVHEFLPIILASEHNHIEIVKLLINDKRSSENQILYSSHFALQKSHKDILLFLLEDNERRGFLLTPDSENFEQLKNIFLENKIKKNISFF